MIGHWQPTSPVAFFFVLLPDFFGALRCIQAVLHVPTFEKFIENR
jgi:hypothetical protein